MPCISWHSLPLAVKQHLIQRLQDRTITQADLEALKTWIDQNPEVPAGCCCKVFPTFTLAGEGRYPKADETDRSIITLFGDGVRGRPRSRRSTFDFPSERATMTGLKSMTSRGILVEIGTGSHDLHYRDRLEAPYILA